MIPRSPRHDAASRYARSGLFKDLRSFAELEDRIGQLPTEKERGDAFEVFVEAYLSTDEMAQAEEVWVIGKVPGDIRERLNLPARDYGYDGVIRTRLGELVAYQAKFRSTRAPLPYAELATFFGISEKADRRIIVTNSIAISAIAESRTSFQSTRGGDFDRLDGAQLAAIAAWIDGIPSIPQPRQPRPHQHAALIDIQRELSAHDRATVVMACGTGKTLVALWAAEAQQPQRVLVLVPSLSLLRQTLHEWAKWTSWGERFRYLCVCSDPKVAKGVDEMEVRPEDADFPVRTDPAIVRQFLDSGANAVSVVFCTYQSAPIVGEAMAGRPPFDLGIFDEAHKTTGREGTRYAFGLQDQNLPIRKRLFLTATPRHYNIGKRDKEGDFAVVSMDDESVYGRVAHRLTFAQAAEQKIIVPYKVVISVVDSEMIDNALMDQSEVAIEGDPVRAKWVAHQIALKRAVEEHNLKRIITFHSSIKAAAAFASGDTEGVGTHLPDFQRFHVSGAQPTADRDEHMRAFAQAQRGVITNARCLTEGVDVPSVDTVAFMNPRRSRVDIVQAVGRAMRTASPDKTCGYVLVPLFLETRKGETLDEAFERSDFDEIAQVLNAMRENDEELSDIIQALMIARGKIGGIDETRLRDKVEVLGPKIQLSELAASIRARLVEELGITWDEHYGQLMAYKQAHGDCNVPQAWTGNSQLGPWCSTQRTRYRNGVLPPDHVRRLEALGFVWNQFEAAWEEMFSSLSLYRHTHGNCNVPKSSKHHPRLGMWCNTQRTLYKSKTLPPDRVQRLEQIGFVWDPYTVAWEEMFSALSAYREAHGDCNVPRLWKENPVLGHWCSTQRHNYSKGELSSDRIQRLDQLGFVWNLPEANWEEMFAALSDYRQARGDCNVPRGWSKNPSLGIWCTRQRILYKNNQLQQDRIKRLEQLGLAWSVRSTYWERMFAALNAYKEVHGDCNVPSEWKDNPQLAAWCQNQRTHYNTGTLTKERVQLLEQLGFVWRVNSSAWEEMFAALIDYKQVHGDCNVSRYLKDNSKLGTWCAEQRKAYKRNNLPPDRSKRLEQLGFVWQVYSSVWDERFAELKTYKQVYGNCNVPQDWNNNPKLGTWCTQQRTRYKVNKRIFPDRIKRLEDIGFVWDQLTVAWEEMFSTLTIYKQTHGNCNVPWEWTDNPQLAAWCANQRAGYKNGSLSPERINRLDQIGFPWNPLAVAWEEMFAELSSYKQAYGDCNVPANWKDNPQLGAWCSNQRTRYKINKISRDRIKRLEEIGFAWSPLAAAWGKMFSALSVYKQLHGDCNVPVKYMDNPQLGTWCAVQRRAYSNDNLSRERIERLGQLGFIFGERDTKKK